VVLESSCLFGRCRILTLICKFQDFPKIASLREKVMLLGILYELKKRMSCVETMSDQTLAWVL